MTDLLQEAVENGTGREVALRLGWRATDRTVEQFARIIEMGMNSPDHVLAVMPLEVMLALNAPEVLVDVADEAMAVEVWSFAAATMPA